MLLDLPFELQNLIMERNLNVRDRAMLKMALPKGHHIQKRNEKHLGIIHKTLKAKRAPYISDSILYELKRVDKSDPTLDDIVSAYPYIKPILFPKKTISNEHDVLDIAGESVLELMKSITTLEEYDTIIRHPLFTDAVIKTNALTRLAIYQIDLLDQLLCTNRVTISDIQCSFVNICYCKHHLEVVSKYATLSRNHLEDIYLRAFNHANFDYALFVDDYIKKTYPTPSA